MQAGFFSGAGGRYTNRPAAGSAPVHFAAFPTRGRPNDHEQPAVHHPCPIFWPTDLCRFRQYRSGRLAPHPTAHWWLDRGPHHYRYGGGSRWLRSRRVRRKIRGAAADAGELPRGAAPVDRAGRLFAEPLGRRFFRGPHSVRGRGGRALSRHLHRALGWWLHRPVPVACRPYQLHHARGRPPVAQRASGWRYCRAHARC